MQRMLIISKMICLMYEKKICDHNYSPIICISSNNATNMIFMVLLFHFGLLSLANIYTTKSVCMLLTLLLFVAFNIDYANRYNSSLRRCWTQTVMRGALSLKWFRWLKLRWNHKSFFFYYSIPLSQWMLHQNEISRRCTEFYSTGYTSIGLLADMREH